MRTKAPVPCLLLAVFAIHGTLTGCAAEDESSNDTGESSEDPNSHHSQSSSDGGDSESGDAESSDIDEEGGLSDGGGGAANATSLARTVPLFVAVGWGGRRVASCDGGRSWPFDVQVADEGEDDWHQAYTPKGLSAGAGSVIFLTGWGTDSQLHVTRNGADWETIETGSAYGGIGFDGESHVLLGNRDVAASPDGGQTWSPVDVETPQSDRETAVFDGVWAAAADGHVQVRTDTEWSTMSSCAESNHQPGIGHAGGFATGNDVLLSIAESGHICRYDLAENQELSPSDLGAALEGKPLFVDNQFVVATGDALRFSHNGASWESAPLAEGVRFDHIARSEERLWVGVAGNGDDFFYSEDGENWFEAEASSGNGITRLTVGRIAPTLECPLF